MGLTSKRIRGLPEIYMSWKVYKIDISLLEVVGYANLLDVTAIM